MTDFATRQAIDPREHITIPPEGQAPRHWRYRQTLRRRFAGFYSATLPRRCPKDKPHPALYGWIDHRKQ